MEKYDSKFFLRTTEDKKRKLIPLEHAFISKNLDMCRLFCEDRFLIDVSEKLKEKILNGPHILKMSDDNRIEFSEKTSNEK